MYNNGGQAHIPTPNVTSIGLVAHIVIPSSQRLRLVDAVCSTSHSIIHVYMEYSPARILCHIIITLPCDLLRITVIAFVYRTINDHIQQLSQF